MMATIGENIIRIRTATTIERPMSQAELSRAAGLSTAAICQYEKGNSLPGCINLLKIAKGLGVTVGALMEGVE